MEIERLSGRNQLEEGFERKGKTGTGFWTRLETESLKKKKEIEILE